MKRNNTLLYVFAVISLTLFVTTTTLSIYTEYLWLDDWVGDQISSIANPTIIMVIESFSIFGSIEAIFLLSSLTLLIFVFQKDWITSFFFAGLSLGGIVLNYVLKFIFQRTRPGEERVIAFFGHEFELASYSFPSGHTMRVTIFFIFLIYLIWRLRLNKCITIALTSLFIIIIAGVSLSRIILEAHYFTDIIGAISSSLFWFSAWLLIIRYIIAKRHPHFY